LSVLSHKEHLFTNGILLLATAPMSVEISSRGATMLLKHMLRARGIVRSDDP